MLLFLFFFSLFSSLFTNLFVVLQCFCFTSRDSITIFFRLRFFTRARQATYTHSTAQLVQSTLRLIMRDNNVLETTLENENQIMSNGIVVLYALKNSHCFPTVFA